MYLTGASLFARDLVFNGLSDSVYTDDPRDLFHVKLSQIYRRVIRCTAP